MIVRASGQWWIRCLAGDEGLQVAGDSSHAHAFEDGDTVGVGPFELVFHASGRAASPPQTDLMHEQTRVFDAG